MDKGSKEKSVERGRTPLSPRLRAIGDMVERGSRLADIGTDHGYLPIRLLEEGRIPSAIAMDVGKGPLSRARAHVEERGLSGRIELRLSDGFAALAPGEADAAVLAGMGGPLMIRILTEGRRTAESLRYLVLSPQSEIPGVRRYLMGNGYRILAEDMVFDEGKYYTVIKAAPGKMAEAASPGEEPWSSLEGTYGRYLLRSGKQEVSAFLRKERGILEAVREELLPAGTGRAGERLTQVERELSLLSEALALAEAAEAGNRTMET